jgi:hypothetical protein
MMRGRFALTSRRSRKGSALVLVLVMTLSMAGLAISAVLLTSSSSLVQRYYDKDKDYRFYARAAIALVKSQAQRDTTFSYVSDTAYRVTTAGTITDASGSTNTTIKVNTYAAYTGDTAGTYIPFFTIMAQAYDTLGIRSTQRLDLQSEAFSRYVLVVDTFLPNTALGAGLHMRGRVHGNRNWNSASSPGTYYYDTVSLGGSSVTGTTTYGGNGIAVTSAKRLRWPTATSLSSLPTLASNGGLSFAQVGSSNSPAYSGGRYISGDATNSTSSARRGSRLRFKTVDVDNDGTIDPEEGFAEIFDLATGIDTSSLRVDFTTASSETSRGTDCNGTNSQTGFSTGTCRSTVITNQCGLMVTISGRKEFFPVARFREAWVRTYVQSSTAPIISAADAAIMGSSLNSPEEVDTTAVKKILSFGVGYSRCFPAGSPYLMLTERYETSACAMDSTVNNYPYAWGGSCATHQYGGQDTTFTANARRCYIRGTSGQCYDDGSGYGLQRLGSWRAFGGTSTVPSLTSIQDAERTYLWPLSTTYNAASRGVIYASGTTPLFVSDTVRGFVTLYAHGRVVLINDLVYDKDPTDPNALCRNMLGVIADTSIKIANTPLNFPRRDPSASATYRFLGTPNFNLHGFMLALSTTTSTASGSNIRAHGTVAVEDSASNAVGGLTCFGVSTSGGCWFHTGGAAMKVYHQSTGAAGTGLLRSVTTDPCQEQQTNRRPPFFPLTGRFVDYKSSEVDTRTTSTWTTIKSYYAALRGNNRKVP